MGQIWVICLYGLKLQRLDIIYACFFYPRVWVLYTHTRTRIPDGYKNSSNNVPAGAKCLPYPPPYRVKPVRYSGFRYPLPS